MSKYLNNLREEELKNIIAKDYFSIFNTTKIIGNIDFCISKQTKKDINQGDLFNEDETQSFLWAEAKKGNKADIIESFIQLILTIGKARTFEKFLPPIYLGAFDCEKISFIEYSKIQEIFVQNDFNWKITPSNHDSKEFKQLKDLAEYQLEKNKLIFNFEEDDRELKKFIKNNFKFGDGRKQNTIKIQITKNNFTTIYLKWLKKVKSTININWDKVKNSGILDADFYLADLLSKDNESIKDNLFVILKKDKYEFNKKIDDLGLFQNNIATFSDNQKAHNDFWMWYERPPKKEFWNYIVERRDLLVPQDVRERKGSYFTPQQWVELSQKYLADTLGENWQDEYYIWDCCAGTGNLLNGLTNKYNIWASTLDKADIDVMKDRIKNVANLLESHIFQMDFLNDNFKDKCPKDLLEIINDPEKRKKLVIYINPPYAEAGSGTGKHKKNVAISNITYEKYKDLIGNASNEVCAQFFIRIYKEIPDCILAEFSKLKILNAPNFKMFKQVFQPKLESLFLAPSNTFDNVKGQFPIGFFIWDLKEKEVFKEINADVYDRYEDNFFDKKLEQNFMPLNNYPVEDMPNEFCSPTLNNPPLEGGSNEFYSFGEGTLNTSNKQNINHLYSKDILEKAMRLRKNKQPAENYLWYFLRNKQMLGLKFRQQQPIGNYIVDFACLSKKLIIELDGGQHNRDKNIKYDDERTKFLNDAGYKVLRFWNNELFNNIYGVLETIYNNLILEDGNIMAAPPQTNKVRLTLPQGEGEEIGKMPQGKGKDSSSPLLKTKKIISYDDKKFISDWFREYIDNSNSIAKLGYGGNDFQHQNNCFIMVNGKGHHQFNISKTNLIQSCIYLSVRQCIQATWLNDRDQFLYPNDGWQNRITNKDGINNWIPFTEMEVEPKNNFESHFMTDYIKENGIIFSSEALAVMEAGKELYKYYHSENDSNPNASFYDIREYFQGRDKNGRMNNKSSDEKYMELLGNLKEKHRMLGDKIAEKVYEYEFLI